MGGSPVSPENNWAADGRWIDNADYDHLIDKLAQHPDRGSCSFVGHDQRYSNARRPRRPPRRWRSRSSGQPRHVRIPFREPGGANSERSRPSGCVESREFKRVMPVTFFALKLAMPESSAQLEIWNRGSGTRLASLDLDRSVPEVRLEPAELRSASGGDLCWRARDRDESDLKYVVTIGPGESQRWPVAYDLHEDEFVLDTWAGAGRVSGRSDGLELDPCRPLE